MARISYRWNGSTWQVKKDSLVELVAALVPTSVAPAPTPVVRKPTISRGTISALKAHRTRAAQAHSWGVVEYYDRKIARYLDRYQIA